MGTPIPSRENEQRGTGAGPVITYRLSPEEMAALSPAKQISDTHHKPLDLPTKTKEDKPVKDSKVTKDDYLKLRSEGWDRKDIARKWGYTKSHLESYWLKRWGIKDQLQEELALEDFSPRNAKPTLSTQAVDSNSQPVEKAGSTDPQPEAPQSDEKEAEFKRLKEDNDVLQQDLIALERELAATVKEVERLRSENVQIVALAGESAAKLIAEKEQLKDQFKDQTDPDYNRIRIELPLHLTGMDRSQQLRVVHAEFEQFGASIEAAIVNRRETAADLLGLLQAFVGLIYAETADLIEETEVARNVQAFFNRLNQEHQEKFDRFVIERDLEVTV